MKLATSMEMKKAARDQIADHHGIPYLCDVFGGVITSFWKRGSFRSGSNLGQSGSSAEVSAVVENAPKYGVEISFCKAAIAGSDSPVCAATRARISSGNGP